MRKNTLNGFTLVELLISISIFSMMLVYMTNVLFGAIKLSGIASDRSKGIGSTVFVLDYITSDILNSSSIGVSSNGDELALNVGGKNVVYSYKDSKVRRQEGGTAAYLTDVNDIDGLKFTYLDGGANINISAKKAVHDLYVYPRDVQ